MKPRAKVLPLTPSSVNRLRQKHFGGQESTMEGRPVLFPYPAFVGVRRGRKGQRVNRSLLFQHSSGLDFRSLPLDTWNSRFCGLYPCSSVFIRGFFPPG
jgi:hypothetical protein